MRELREPLLLLQRDTKTLIPPRTVGKRETVGHRTTDSPSYCRSHTASAPFVGVVRGFPPARNEIEEATRGCRRRSR